MGILLKHYFVLKVYAIWLGFYLIAKVGSTTSSGEDFMVKLPGVTTEHEDTYVCYFWKPPFSGTRYVTSFTTLQDSPHVHHIMISACSGQIKENIFKQNCDYACYNPNIYFVWARNAPSTVLPKGAAFLLGSNEASFLKMVVHYNMPESTPDHTAIQMKITPNSQPYHAGVILYLLNSVEFPQNTKQILANISCLYDEDVDVVPFAFRTHTHNHGRVLTGYVYRGGQWLLIGKGNPLWPQAFWPVQTEGLRITKGDYVVVRAVYSTENETGRVEIGSTHNDEMCNFYIMYYKNASAPKVTSFCTADNYPSISALIPAEANVPLPPNKTMDTMATMHHPHHGDHHQDQLKDGTESIQMLSISPVDDWPALPEEFSFGQMSGLSKDQQGFLYIFHRGSFVWDGNIFDPNNVYALDKNKPIKEATIAKLETKTGVIVKQAGSKYFYVPHGIFVDSQNFIWLTDVALHQVFKFSADIFDGGDMKPLLALGTRFEPGSDSNHFCKPTDLVVSELGEIFVSDGYCNQRIVVFDKSGNYLREMKIEVSSSSFPPLPHSISLDDEKKLLYVSERLALVISVYQTNGSFLKEIRVKEFKYELFAVQYNPATDKLFCVIGNLIQYSQPYHAQVFIVDPNDSSLVSTWKLPESSSEFDTPHDIEVSSDGRSVFLAILGTAGKLLNFQASSQNKNLGLQEPFYHRHPLKLGPYNDTIYTAPNLASALLVLLCLLVIPLLIIIGAIVYIRHRQKKQVFQYTKLRDREAKRAVNGGDAGRVSELKTLSAASEEDDEDEDAFDVSLYTRNKNNV